MRNCSILVVALVMALPNSAAADQCKVQVTPPGHGETILSTDDINRLTRGDIIDAPVSIYHNSAGELFWLLPTAMQRNSMVYLSHTVVKGPDLKTATTVGIYNQSKMFVNSPAAVTSVKGYKWITNTYQIKDGVLGFVHMEYAGPKDYWGMPCIKTVDGETKCAPGHSKIGLAWMDTPSGWDGVPRFTFLGAIATYTAGQAHFNVQGTPYTITHDDQTQYLNIWFADKNSSEERMNVAWARAPLTDVLAAAKRGTTTKWQKYNDGAWEDALTGKSSPAVPVVPKVADVDRRVAYGRITVHSDIVKHKETGRYFLSAYTLQDPSFPSHFVFYDSCDGHSWKFNAITNPTTSGGQQSGWSYMMFMDDNGSDNGEASGPFDLLSGYDYGGPQRRVEKFKVTVNGDCACPASQ